MPKAKIYRDSEGRFYGIAYNCPCGQCGTTILPVRWLPAGEAESPHVANMPHWEFNGDFEQPVFSPSVLSSWESHPDDGAVVRHVCHSFIGINGASPGSIIFLGDSTHSMTGQTVSLPDLV